MPAWLIWTIAVLAGWTFLALAVSLLVGHGFQQVGAWDETLSQITEEAEHLDWSVAPLARDDPTETERLQNPIPGSRTGRGN